MNKQIQTEADELGFFGEYGGQYVPETLMSAYVSGVARPTYSDK